MDREVRSAMWGQCAGQAGQSTHTKDGCDRFLGPNTCGLEKRTTLPEQTVKGSGYETNWGLADPGICIWQRLELLGHCGHDRRVGGVAVRKAHGLRVEVEELPAVRGPKVAAGTLGDLHRTVNHRVCGTPGV